MNIISSRIPFSTAGSAGYSSQYVNVIRTDARFSTKKIRFHLERKLRNGGDNDPALPDRIKDVVHGAYAKWGESVIAALNEHAVYQNSDDVYDEGKVPFHLYDARNLTHDVLQMAHESNTVNGVRPTLVSLDDMITTEERDLHEIAFSRLFSHDGKNQYDYVPRPGYGSLEDQFKKLVSHLDERREREGIDVVPLVLLEDNVRHAKMLNWLFEKMEDHGVFERAKIKEIVSCFCCAKPDELNKIRAQGELVPVRAVVEHKRARVDVITPRDLFFDGFVIDVKGEHARLPGIFMDYESRFKINPDETDRFHKKVLDANIAFCDDVKRGFGLDLKVGWFAVSKGICHVTGAKESDNMKDLLVGMLKPAPEVGLTRSGRGSIKPVL